MGTEAKSYLIRKPEVTLPEKVIEEVTGAGPADAVAVASSLPEAQRAALAQFCYGRRHLRHLGLEIAGTLSKQSLMDTLGASLTEAVEGRVVIEMPYRSSITQQDGYAHAGAIAAIADSACGYSALTLLPASRHVLTVEFKINLMAPAIGETFIAEGTVIRSGRTLSVCRAEVTAVKGSARTAVASMQATIFAMDRADA